MKLETQSYHGHFIQSLYKEYLLSLTFLHLTTPLVCSTGPGDRLLVSPWDGGLVQPARAPAEVSVCTHSCYLINITKSLIFQSHEFRMLIKTQWQLLTVGFTTVVVRGGKLTPSRPNAGEIGLGFYSSSQSVLQPLIVSLPKQQICLLKIKVTEIWLLLWLEHINLHFPDWCEKSKTEF